MNTNASLKVFTISIICGLIPLLSLCQVQPAAYSGSAVVNAISTIDLLSPEASASAVVNKALKDARTTTSYFDGLGRSLQTTIRQGSFETGGTATDLVSSSVYDVFGRVKYNFLPFASSSNNGAFKTDPFQQQAGFYGTQLSGQSETYYYAQTNFEASPLNRPIKSLAPGNSWVGANRGIESKYWTNTDLDDVKKWTITDNADAWGSYLMSGVYTAGELIKTVTVDEHGKQVIEFKDKEGLVIQKKVQLTATADDGMGKGYPGWLVTLYIYDPLGRLRLVVQPKGVEQLITNSWNPTAGFILAEHCFRYEYDLRSRMVMKKVPGADEVWMVYDAKDRLVLTQDALQRSQNKWMYMLYDAFNRPVTTGLWNNSQNRVTHKNAAWGLSTYPNLSGQTIEELSNTFYDDYNWRSTYGNPLNNARVTTYDGYLLSPNTTWPYPELVTSASSLKGLMTGTRTKVLGSSPVVYMYTVNIYDAKLRLVQVQSTNLTGGTDLFTTQYSWNGQPLITIQKEEKAGGTAQTSVVITKINYDDLWRVQSTEKN